MDHRQKPRVPVSLAIMGAEQNKPLPLMFSRDISTGGIAVESGEVLAEDSGLSEGVELNMSFALPFGSNFFKVVGKIVWLRHNYPNNLGQPVSLIGIEFVNPAPQLIADIEQYIQRSQSGKVTVIDRRQADSDGLSEPVQSTAEQAPPIHADAATSKSVSAGQKVAPQALQFQPETIQFYTDHLLQPQSDQPLDALPPLEQLAKRFSQGLLPKERALLRAVGASGEHFKQLITLNAKIEIETKQLEKMIAAKSLGGDADSIQQLSQHYAQLLPAVVDPARSHVSVLYSEAKNSEGQEITQWINRLETSMKRCQSILAQYRTQLSLHQGESPIKPVKYYFDAINQAATLADSENSAPLTVLRQNLAIWEIQAFQSQDPYWDKDERPIVAGLAALNVKIAEEMLDLIELYKQNIGITDYADACMRDAAKLLAKIEPRYAAWFGQPADKSSLHNDKQQKLTASMEAVRNSVQSIQDLLNSSKGNLNIDTSQLVAHYNQKIYDGHRAKADAKTPTKQATKTKSKKAKKSWKVGVSLSAVAILAITLAMKLIHGSAPHEIENQAYKTVVEAKEMSVAKICANYKCEKWLLVTLKSEPWLALSYEDKVKKAEMLWELAKKDGIQKLELKVNQKTAAITAWHQGSKKVVLQVRSKI